MRDRNEKNNYFYIIFYIYYNIHNSCKIYKLQIRAIKNKKENLEYETCLNKQIFGTELTTFINKAVDNNEKNKILKDGQGFYIQNDINSMEIEIKITDNDSTYKMETLYNGGMVNFVDYYNSIYFECTKIEYNKLGKVSYLLFEQKSN